MVDEVLPEHVQVVDHQINRPNALCDAGLRLRITRQVEPVLHMRVAGAAAQMQASRIRYAFHLRLAAKRQDTAVEVPAVGGSFFRETFAVLAAILVAFGLDALWALRVERDDTQSALEATRDEFLVVRGQIEEAIEMNRRGVLMKDRFIGLGPEEFEELSEDEALDLVWSLRLNWTLDPSRGALDALIATGRVDRVEDRRLKALLTGWPGVYQDLEEHTVQSWRDRVTARKAEVGREGRQRRVRADIDDGRPSAAFDLLELAKRDPELAELAAAFAGELEAYLLELEPARERVEETLRLLDDAIR